MGYKLNLCLSWSLFVLGLNSRYADIRKIGGKGYPEVSPGAHPVGYTLGLGDPSGPGTRNGLGGPIRNREPETSPKTRDGEYPGDILGGYPGGKAGHP